MHLWSSRQQRRESWQTASTEYEIPPQSPIARQFLGKSPVFFLCLYVCSGILDWEASRTNPNTKWWALNNLRCFVQWKDKLHQEAFLVRGHTRTPSAVNAQNEGLDVFLPRKKFVFLSSEGKIKAGLFQTGTLNVMWFEDQCGERACMQALSFLCLKNGRKNATKSPKRKCLESELKFLCAEPGWRHAILHSSQIQMKL